MNEITYKVDKERNKRNWTVYRLSEESGVAQQTIHNWFSTDTYPLIPALKNICKAFGMTMGDFFSENDLVELTPERKVLIDDYSYLTASQKESVKLIIKNYKNIK